MAVRAEKIRAFAQRLPARITQRPAPARAASRAHDVDGWRKDSRRRAATGLSRFSASFPLIEARGVVGLTAYTIRFA